MRQPFLRLVNIDIFGMPTGRRDNQPVFLPDCHLAHLAGKLYPLPDYQVRVASQGMHNLLILVEHGVERQVHPNLLPDFLNILAGGIVFVCT